MSAAGRTWIVLRRDLSATVTIATGEDVWITMVLDEETGRVVGNHLAQAPAKSLQGALRAAFEEPLAGAPAGRPSLLVVEPGMGPETEVLLARLGGGAEVVEERAPDWASDVIDGLTAHMSGRLRSADWPEPEEWALLYQQAASYARARPWERYDDSFHLRLELKVGSQRQIRAATVLGNAGLVRGIVLHPGERVPAQIPSGDQSRPPPGGTIHFSLNRRDELPPDIASRADRYGWPPDLAEVPAFLSWKAEGGGEIERAEAALLTVALAAAADAAAADRGLGFETKGELILGGGRRARYRARFESNLLPLPPGLRVYSGEVRQDLIPEGAVVGLGGIPWDDLERVRARARHHQVAPSEGPPVGEGLPVLIIAPEGKAGERVAEKLAETEVHGVALIEQGDECLILILTEGGAYGAAETARGDTASDKFKRRLRATGGWHAVIVAPPSFRRTDPIHGFFECVLAPPAQDAATLRPRGLRHPSGRRRRR
jgi:hypothetical protein